MRHRFRFSSFFTAAFFLCIAVISGWLFFPFIFESVHGIRLSESTLSGIYGSLSALVAGLAFVGVGLTFLLQHTQLTEMREARERQEFENTFFRLLEIHHGIVNALDLRDKTRGHEIAKGRDCFGVFFRRFQDHYGAKASQRDPQLGRDESRIALIGTINTAYRSLYDESQSDLGHYFRNMYRLVTIASESKFNRDCQYTKIIRAQLSSYEVLMLFYNCLSPRGSESFKKLVEKYGLLKDMPFELVIEPGRSGAIQTSWTGYYSHLDLYLDSAYEGTKPPRPLRRSCDRADETPPLLEV